MATKKKAEEEVVVATEATEAKTTTKKTRKATAKKAEEPKTEEPKTEEPVVEVVEEVKPKKATKKVEEPKAEEPTPIAEEPKKEAKAEFPYKAIISAKSGLDVLKGPALTYNKVGFLGVGVKVVVLEVKGNFGRIGIDRWVNINYIKKI